MLLEMDLQDIPQIKSTTLHLRHVKCKPQHVTETSVIFRVPFHGCGTVRGATLENMTRYITYSNQVKNTPLKLNSSGIRVSYVAKLHYPFSCYYRQKYVVAIQQRTNDHEGSHVNQGIEGLLTQIRHFKVVALVTRPPNSAEAIFDKLNQLKKNLRVNLPLIKIRRFGYYPRKKKYCEADVSRINPALRENKDKLLNIESFKPFKDSVRGQFYKGGKPLESNFRLG